MEISPFITTGSGGDIVRVGAWGGIINTGAGDDQVIAGVDYFGFAFAGFSYRGGDGVDLLSYETAPDSVDVDLVRGDGGVDGAFVDLFSGFENLRGSAFSDLLAGDDGANVIEGGGGSDEIHGRGGDDRIILSSSSVVYGGAGYDTLVLRGGHTYELGGALQSIERVRLIDGAVADFRSDEPSSEATPDLFISHSETGGGVRLTTADRAETIRLGEGADRVNAGGGDDSIFVYGGGAATIEGGDGFDTLVVQSGDHAYSDATLSGVERILVRSGASLDLGDMTSGPETIVSGSAVAGDGATIVGSKGADRIYLGRGGDDVTGGSGADVLIAGAGDDTFRYNAGGFGRDKLLAVQLANDHVDLSGVADGVDDLTFKYNADETGVVVLIDGLRHADSILLKGFTIAQVEAAADDGFFTF